MINDSAKVIRRKKDDFEVLGLENRKISMEVAPTQGARILSFRDKASALEWLWPAADGRGLFPCDTSTPFERSSLAGIDE